MSNTSRLVAAISIIAGLVLGITVFFSSRPAVAAQDEKSGATFQVYKDKADKYRWRLVTLNKQTIATSGEGYADKRGCLNGIDSVKKNAQAAKVEEVQAAE